MLGAAVQEQVGIECHPCWQPCCYVFERAVASLVDDNYSRYLFCEFVSVLSCISLQPSYY